MIVRRVLESEWLTYKTLRLRALQLAPEAFGSCYEDAVLISDDEWQTRVARFARDSAAVNLMAFVNGEAAGMVSCFVREKAEMIQMWVEPDARGAGVGDALIESLCDWLRAAGVDRVFADVYESNLSAAKLYLKRGFAVIGKTEDAAEVESKRIELHLSKSL